MDATVDAAALVPPAPPATCNSTLSAINGANASQWSNNNSGSTNSVGGALSTALGGAETSPNNRGDRPIGQRQAHPMLASKRTNRAAILLVTSDKDFARAVEQAFGASEHVGLEIVQGPFAAGLDVSRLAGKTVAVVDVNLQNPDELVALERLMAGMTDGPPVVVLTDRFDQTPRPPHDADAYRRLLAKADFAGRAGARLRAGDTQSDSERRRRGSADLRLPAGRRRRRRHHACRADRDDSAQQRQEDQGDDLPGRPRFSARRLRRLSRHRAAAQSRRNRATARAARSPIARSDAVLSRVRARRHRRAELVPPKCARSIRPW